MLHAPVSENKTQDKQSKTQSEPESERRALGWASYPALGLGCENGSSAGNERARGWQPINLSTLSQGGILQRKCACGSSAGAAGTCSECQSKEGRMLQTKLSIGEPGDKYEQEADQVAEQVMRMPETSIQRRVRPQKEEERIVQRKTISNQAFPFEQQQESSIVLSNVNKHPAESDLIKGGERLLPSVAEFYETRFGRDFSSVRVHTGETSLRYNDALNAYAFTYGSHIWLGTGLQQQPSNILAHELAHVVQQTQPSPLASTDSSGQPGLSSSSKTVQCYKPYWMPNELEFWKETKRGLISNVGGPTHQLVLPEIGKENNIFTEAPVPNADRNGPDFDKFGRADLYEATSTVGVYFTSNNIPQDLKSNRDLKYKGLPYSHIKNSAPKFDKNKGRVILAGKAPTEILVGDLKPSHETIESQEGPKQVEDYLKGFQFARRELNEMKVGTDEGQTDEKWKQLKTGIIKELKIPDKFKEETGGSGQESKNLVLVKDGKEIDRPKPVKGKRREYVKGKVYIKERPKGGGIWNYSWLPDLKIESGKLPASVTGLETDITAKIIKPLLVSPVTAKTKAKPSSFTPSPRRIQAREREKVAEVKDPFDKTAFNTWKIDHLRLADKEKSLENTPEFEETKYKSLVLEARETAQQSGFNHNPAISEKENKVAKTFNKIQFWTNPTTKILGKLRYGFGGLFVKVINAYHSIRNRFQKFLHKQDVPKKGGLLGTVVRIAFDVLKIAGRFVVERTVQHLVNSLKEGVEQKLKSLIPEEKIEEFEAKVAEIEKFADDLEKRAVETVEALVEKTVGPYMEYIKTIVDVARNLSTVSEIVSKVRWGARVLACLSPPGWGCLFILAESVIEKFASWLVDKCWFKKEISPLITGINFITSLPMKLASFIIDGIKGLLPNDFQDVLAEINPQNTDTSIPPDRICDENDEPTARDRNLVERLALAELSKEIGEEKWKAWTEIGKLYGVNRADPLTEEQIVQLKKDLKKADLAALKEAAALSPVLSTQTNTIDVINLTTFLERTEQVKQEMNGGGDSTGDSDEGGINVSASQKALPGKFKPTKLGFKVVEGIKKKPIQGQIVKVDLAALVNGTIVTLENVEVVIKKLVFIPDKGNPKKLKVYLEVTKDQYFDIEKKYGLEVVNRIHYKRLNYKKGVKLIYEIDLQPDRASKSHD